MEKNPPFAGRSCFSVGCGGAGGGSEGAFCCEGGGLDRAGCESACMDCDMLDESRSRSFCSFLPDENFENGDRGDFGVVGLNGDLEKGSAIVVTVSSRVSGCGVLLRAITAAGPLLGSV